MVEVPGGTWGMILLGLVGLMVVAWLVLNAGTGGTPPDPAKDPVEPPWLPQEEEEEPEPLTLGDWRNEQEEREVPACTVGWAECFCCGCPAVDSALDFAECEVCGWDGDVDGVEEDRAAFARHGSVHLPDEAAALGQRPVSAEERRIALKLAAACAAVPEGEAPPPEFWSMFYDELDRLRRVRADRSGTGWTG
jgi:hypothetical protein